MLTATSQSSSSPEDDDVDMGREIAPGTSLTVRNATDRDDQREKLGKELSWIIYHDDYWQKCVAEQIDHEATVVRSLAVLLSAMTRLEKIEIRSPELSSDLFRRIRTIQYAGPVCLSKSCDTNFKTELLFMNQMTRRQLPTTCR